uniref:Suppressor APC domain-containing protein 1 n=1 Tax=Pogona vitticeps TaxID=103695 RepID=A0ABM5FIG7_9SAUR
MNSEGLTAPPLPTNPENPAPSLGTRLPRPFLHSLRTLFEILDDQRSGTIHVSEIESRWGRGGSGVRPQGDQERAQLPSGVLQALQQVAEPCGGYLSFPRLVAGLRIALLRAEEEEDRAEAEKAGESARAEQAEGGQSASQSMKNLSRIRESDGKSITRSRSINSSLCQAGRRRSLRLPKEPRRHTISNALEYDMLKRMQELERERDALLQGLEMVDRMRDWFQRHLLEAQRRQKHMGAEASYFPENQNHLLLAKIQEVNLCLKNLLTSPGKSEVPPGAFGAPLYSLGKKEFHHQAVTVLKEQNHLLIKEVSEKSDRIAQLEQEKAALCQQLKERRGYRLPSHKESTFI